MQLQTSKTTGLQKGPDTEVKKFTPEHQMISSIQKPAGPYNFTGFNASYQGKHQTKLREESFSDLSQLSLPSKLDNLFSSNDASIKNHIQVDWTDPNLSSFDPFQANHIISQQHLPVSRPNNNELSLLMEENLMEVENNFPTYERLQTEWFHTDRQMIPKTQFTDYRPPSTIAPIPNTTTNYQPQLQILTNDKQHAQIGLVIESLTSFHQESENNLGAFKQSKARISTVLDVAGLDMEPQSSKDLSQQINFESEPDQLQAINLGNELEQILGPSESKIQTEAQLYGTSNLTGKVTNSTLQNNRTEEECELAILDEDGPSGLFQKHSNRVSHSKPSRSLTASQHIFEERVPTKTGSEPVRIEPRQYREENSRSDSA